MQGFFCKKRRFSGGAVFRGGGGAVSGRAGGGFRGTESGGGGEGRSGFRSSERKKILDAAAGGTYFDNWPYFKGYPPFCKHRYKL